MLQRITASSVYVIAVSIVLAFVQGASCGAGPVLPLAITDAVGFKHFNFEGNIGQFSPSGDMIAFVKCDPLLGSWHFGIAAHGIQGATGGCRLYVISSRGGATMQVGRAHDDIWDPSWSPDGKKIAYLSNSGGAAHLWIWDRITNRVRQVASLTIDGTLQEPVVWLHGSRNVVVALFTSEYLRANASSNASIAQQKKTTLVLLHSGSTNVQAGADTLIPIPGPEPNDIAAIDISTGSVRTLVRNVHPTMIKLSPDGTLLAYTNLLGSLRISYMTSISDLHIYDLQSQTDRMVAPNIRAGSIGRFSWSPNSSMIAYVSDLQLPTFAGTQISQPFGYGTLLVVQASGGTPRGFSGDRNIFFSSASGERRATPLWSLDGKNLYMVTDWRIWHASLETGAVASIAMHNARQIDSLLGSNNDVIWSPDGRAVYAVTVDPNSQWEGFGLVDLVTGTLHEAWECACVVADHYHDPVASNDQSHMLFDLQSATRSENIWVADSGFRSVQQLTNINPQLQKYTFGQTKLFHFVAKDGQRLPFAILFPAGYRPGHRYPTLVWVYASDDESSYLYHFGFWLGDPYNFQLLATRGYAMLAPAIPVKMGAPLAGMLNAVGPAIDRGVALGIVDPNRLAVSGQSNGGYTTLSLITHMHRFKAAIMNAGFGDLTGFYGCMTQTYSPIWIDWLSRGGGAMGVPPWKDPQRYILNSPVYFLDRIATPLLMEDGSDDKCIIEYSDQVFIDLQSMNKNVTYLRYGGETHVLEQRVNILDYWTHVLAFLHDYLNGAP